MNYKNIINNIEELSYDSIFSMDDSELDNELSSLNINVDEELKVFNIITTNTILTSKKNKLLQAREHLNNQASYQAKKEQIVDFLSKKHIDAKGYLISLIMSGKTTMAFRDGQDISDDEAVSIIDNLIELGEVKLDE
jgi:hypothetical protein